MGVGSICRVGLPSLSPTMLSGTSSHDSLRVCRRLSCQAISSGVTCVAWSCNQARQRLDEATWWIWGCTVAARITAALNLPRSHDWGHGDEIFLACVGTMWHWFQLQYSS